MILFFYFVSEGKKYPVCFDYWISDIYYDADERYIDKNDLFIKNLTYLISQGLNFENVIADAGFFNKKIVEYLLSRDINFVLRSKSNKKLDNGFKLNQLFENDYNGSFYYYHKYKSFLKSDIVSLFDKKVKIVAIANTKQKLVEKELFFLATNNLNLKLTGVLVLYKLRWSIEGFFKILKSYLSLSVFYRNNYEYVDQRISLSLIAFFIVSHKANDIKQTFYQTLKHIQQNEYSLDIETILKYCDNCV